MVRVVLIGLICILSAMGCQGHTSSAPRVIRSTLETTGINGISGLSETGTPGVFVAVAERSPLLLTLEVDAIGQLKLAAPPTPLVGIPDGFDLESIAWLGDTRFALGTEARWQETSEGAVLLVDARLDGVHFEEQREIPYALWTMRANKNQGLEGMCSVEDTLLVAVETVTTLEDGARHAPLAMAGTSQSHWTPLWLELTSDTGKIASIECWREDGHIMIIAIERHFGVGRLLWFRVPSDTPAPSTLLKPVRVMDLAPHIDPLPNLESVVRLDDDSVLLVSDNQGSTASGPTFVFVVQLPESASKH